MSVQQLLLGSGASGYLMDKSLRFRASASASLSRTPSSTGNQTTWTWSGWVKRGTLGSEQSIFSAGVVSPGRRCEIYFLANDTLSIYTNSGSGSTDGDTAKQITTSQVFRDPSAWYHIVAAVDTTQATAANRLKLYVNGIQVSALASSAYPSQNHVTAANGTAVHYHGRWVGPTLYYYDGYLAEVNLIDGQALTPSSFGETNALTGVWQPKAYTGTYGTNGFILDFEDTSSVAALGTDTSGNGNTWTVNNISLTAGVTYDSMTDVPTLTSATASNYCVLNPIGQGYPGDPLTTISNGNLTSFASGVASRLGSFGVSSGKYYYEFNKTAGSGNINVGFAGVNGSTNIVIFQMGVTGGGIIVNGTYVQTFGNVTGNFAVAFDVTNLTFSVYNNNSLVGTTVTTGITAGTYTPLIGCGGAGATIEVNFGQRPFAYTPPTGFVALNTFNLPTSTIVKGNTVMDATLYTGNGSTQTITNAAGFQPDLVWAKVRSASGNHSLYDSVRGATKRLSSSLTSAESTFANSLTSFNANGFSLGANVDGDVNASGSTYVAWQWQAGQGTTSSNTNGSITSTVSVNATAGFSVVTYTGNGVYSTIGHGLGVAPKMVIVKSRSNGSWNWGVWHTSLTGTTPLLTLNTTGAVTNLYAAFRPASNSSSVVGLGDEVTTNSNGATYVAYCFAEIDGFSKFGNYAGNGSTDGPFVYTGFRPKWVMIKCFGAAASWVMLDSSRDVYNPETNALLADNSAAEGSGYLVDFLSNGFKVRNTGSGTNSAGTGYIYAAFAENPFKNSLAR